MRASTICALVVFLAGSINIGVADTVTPHSHETSSWLPVLKLPQCETPEEGSAAAISCYRDEREKISKYLDDLLQDIYTNYTSHLGTEADKEFKSKIKAAQSGWEQYKSNHCFFNYNSKASTHPPSASIRMIKCEILMTYDRIKEVRNTYKDF